MTVGIICEYNPFHLGHQRQFHILRDTFGPEVSIVCAMSGNFVQRGEPAIFDKTLRAKAAIASGADLVLELPLTAAVSSAEGFAAGGVQVLSSLCGTLCFGAETPNGDQFLSLAEGLLSPAFPEYLRPELEKGLSFPAARERALTAMGQDASLLQTPNNILGVEYAKAILSQGSPMALHPIFRPGSYHAAAPDAENPSATSLRNAILSGQPWEGYTAPGAYAALKNANVHTLQAGERAILYRLRTMTDDEFEALPFGSEGLWRKLMHESRRQPDLDSILAAVKSKRYTRTRLNRMLLCAFLGITQEDMAAEFAPTQILAFNDRGRALLSAAKKRTPFRNPGQKCGHPTAALEERASSLYGLFSVTSPEPPDAERHRRLFYQNG